MKLAERFRHVAEVLRSAQRAAIEVENAPERRKRLRTFSAPEVAGLLGIPQRELRIPQGEVRRPIPVATRLTFEQLQALRGQVSGVAPAPNRRSESGEALATIVFTNFKGGSAKTTSSVHFSQYLSLAGYRVLLVDLDTQASATAQFGIDPAGEVSHDSSFAAWVSARNMASAALANSLCQPTYWPTIDIVPAGPNLSEAEDDLSRRAASGAAEDVFYFEELAAFLSAVGGRYDVAVIDTRPDVNMLMTAALHAATGIIVPTRATMTDLASTGEFFAHLANYAAEFHSAFGQELSIRFTRILVAAYDPTDRSQEALLGLLRERFGDLVIPGEFLHSRVIGTAGFVKETLYEYEPTTDRAAYNRALASVNAVNRAIEAEIWRVWDRPPKTELPAELGA